MDKKTKRTPGVIRVAFRAYKWHDFNLRPGCAFGLDFNGDFVASFATKSSRFAMQSGQSPNTIIVFRCVNQNKSAPIKKTKTVWGNHSTAVGRRPVIVEAGNYAAPWGYVWQPEEVERSSDLGRAIIRAVALYHKGQRKK